MTNVIIDGVTIPLKAKNVAIIIPECPGLVYSLWISDAVTHIVAERGDNRKSLAGYPTVREALDHFKAIVIREETCRRADETLARMQKTLELAIATPLDADADDGL